MFAFSLSFGQKNTVELISSNENETVLKFNLNSFDYKTVTTQNGEETVIISEKLIIDLRKASPDMPKFSTSMIIPDLGSTKYEIVSAEFTTINNIQIAPSKGNFTRDIDPSSLPYEYGKVYSEDAFFPKSLVNLNRPYIARDFRGQAVHVYPFTYNPVKDELRVYSEIIVKIVSDKSQGHNEFYRTHNFSTISKEFKKLYGSHFINFDSQTKYTPLEEEGNMLIICYDDWTDEVQPLVDWKNTIGRPCEIVPVSEVGSSSSDIKTYVQNYYTNNGLTFLLLVGDAAQVPSSYNNGDSDNDYAYVTGDDHYLEFFVGRFSAESASDVETQVLRTIEYEKGDMLTAGWLNKIMSVGSQEGPGDDGEYDYEHLRNMQDDLIAFTYADDPIYEYFEGSQGGFDQAGHPSASDVANGLNAGLGIANYTGHGSTTSWSSSGFSVSDINNLSNDNMLPFIWSVACVNGNFVGNTCFGEAWMRAENSGEPTGAIAIMASTINQSWSPPMAAQDEMVDLLVGTSTNGIKRSFTGLAINGCFLMNEEYGDVAMTDTWTCFGDPSLMVRTDDPSNMTISHNDVVIIGESTFDVTCDLDDAVATLSRDGEIIGSALVSGGSASVPVTGVTPGETLTLAVTGFNKVTYMADLDVISPSGPYVVVDSYINEINYGETVNLDISLKNVGQDDAFDVTATVSSDDPNVSITNATYVFGDINAGLSSDPSSNAFSVSVSDELEDQYQVAFDIEITDGSKTLWQQTKVITVNAPVLSIGDMMIANDDDENGVLDPGESAELNLSILNEGHADANFVLCSVFGDNPYFTVMDNDQTVSVSAEGTTDVVFNVTATSNAPEGSVVNLNFDVSQGVYTADKDDVLTIGQAPEVVVGTGNESPSSYYPFDNYYENGKTQILYLGSELGTGELNIQEIAFDFTNIGEYETFNNMIVNILETDLTEIASGLYVDMSESTEVLNEEVYTMPTENGWFSMDVTDFVFDTQNNLIVEIIWGDNGAWDSNKYTVNCTNTAYNSVAYGYADYETPPDYDDVTTTRPNVTFFIEGEEPGESYNITFTVVDEGSTPMTNASVMVGSYNQDVDENGQAMFELAADDYYYTVHAEGCSPHTNVVMSVSEDDEVTVMMGLSAVNELQDEVSIYPNPNKGRFFVDFGKTEISEVAISLYSINGQKLFETKPKSQRTEVDLSGFTSGVYFVKIVSGDDVYTSRLIVQ
jgi:uncharacterized membrane protein